MRGNRLCIYVQKRTKLDPSPVFISVMKCPAKSKLNPPFITLRARSGEGWFWPADI